MSQGEYAERGLDDTPPAAGESIGKKAAGGFMWALVGFLLMQVGSFATYTIATKILGTDSRSSSGSTSSSASAWAPP
jgi:hypothetical protein